MAVAMLKYMGETLTSLRRRRAKRSAVLTRPRYPPPSSVAHCSNVSRRVTVRATLTLRWQCSCKISHLLVCNSSFRRWSSLPYTRCEALSRATRLLSSQRPMSRRLALTVSSTRIFGACLATCPRCQPSSTRRIRSRVWLPVRLRLAL